jgi:hypothetical protein
MAFGAVAAVHTGAMCDGLKTTRARPRAGVDVGE